MSTPSSPLLQVRDLTIGFRTPGGIVEAVTGVDLDVAEGETVAIVGESGSGKSTTAMAVIGLLAGNGDVSRGSIRFDGTELVGLAESRMQKVRGASIGLVPQDPMSNLNPVSKVGTQVAETLRAHDMVGRDGLDAAVHAALAAAGLPDPAATAKQYPHELSGGMRQRALIAIGLACRPRLLIADEPTSALDVTVQRTILDQIERMTDEFGTSVLLITHDLGLAAERAARVVVMSKGRVVETGSAEQILSQPEHEYTRRLVAAAPSVAIARAVPISRPTAVPTAAAGEGEGADGSTGAPTAAAPDAVDNIVEIRDLTKVYRRRGRRDDFVAVDGVSLSIPRGSTVAIVGESGSGKTTTARMLLRAIEPTSGSIRFDGEDVSAMDTAALRRFRENVQPVFQDPYSSLNPSFTVQRIIEEPLAVYGRGSGSERRARVHELLEQVSLPTSTASRYPSQLSGGQRQRVAIARALALKPRLIVCDEPVSALDVLVQAQILDLLADLQRELGLSYLFISHDLAVVRLISDHVCVMQNGRIVEQAPSEQLFESPQHPYTKALLASIPGAALGAA
ncbi:ABC transporter ATP-binding protein [Microcella daejeonensis]|uniref:ABC transporter ATP-binding protein n=1 Tax=Microcella daejeonensis TaxID=2994971 RepID=UPI0022712467|nr:ABC transporter ATP-binding protein [Microcella daejeonensis]WAB83013.1 ABC transporter ATP-binding protein [Microcella daejeonensis]